MRFIQNFLCTGKSVSRKLIVVDWKKVCRPCVDGGLGLHDLRLQNEAFLKKLAWNVLTEESQVFLFLRAWFLKDHYVPKLYKFSSLIWGVLRDIFCSFRTNLSGWFPTF